MKKRKRLEECTQFQVKLDKKILCHDKFMMEIISN